MAQGLDGRRTLPPVKSGDWVGIAANAASGRGRGRSLVGRLAKALERRGIEPRVAWTLDEREALVLESSIDDRCRCLVATGGDGTVAALINERPGVPLAVLPAGTENLFAGHFQFGTDPETLAEVVERGEVATLDLGETQGRRFALMAGVGFDAEVVTRHHEIRVGSSGTPRPTNRAAYVDPVVRTSLAYRFPTLRANVLHRDGEEAIEGTTIFVFNLPRYALKLPFAPDASGEDGLLDLVVFRDGGPIQALRYLWLVLRGLHLKRPGVYHRRVRRVSIEADQPVAIQLDGDPGGLLHPGVDGGRLIEVVPGGVEVLVPPTSAKGRRQAAFARFESPLGTGSRS